MTLALVHFLAVVVPGPDFAITVRQSLRWGRTMGMVTAAGIGAGISLHVGYTLLGVGALLHSYPWLVQLTSLVGATYLAYLGFRLLQSRAPRSEWDSMGEAAASGSEDHAYSWKNAFFLGFLTNATNPKATLFFLAMFATLVRPSTPLWIQTLYGIWMCAVNAAWFMLVALFFTRSAVRQGFMRFGKWIESFMGILLLIFALRLYWTVMA